MTHDETYRDDNPIREDFKKRITENASMGGRLAAIAANFEGDPIAMQRFPGLPRVLREAASLLRGSKGDSL